MSRAPTKLHPPSPLAQIDAEIAEIEARCVEVRAVVERSVERIGDLGYAPTPEGEFAAETLAGLEAQIDELRRRRIRVIAGVPETTPPQQKAAAPRSAGPWPPQAMGKPSWATPEDVRRIADAEAQVRAVVRQHGGDHEGGLYQAIVIAMASMATTRDVLVEVIRDHKARIDDLENRIAEAPLRWAGTYQRALEYAAGAVVAHDGSSWVALRAVAPGETPGAAPAAWQLAAKRGRDGKDAPRA